MAAYLLTQDREILAKSTPIYVAGSKLVHLLICYTCCQAPVQKMGSACVPRTGERVLAIANCSLAFRKQRLRPRPEKEIVSARRRNQHARRMRYPETRRGANGFRFPLIPCSLRQTH